jgi:gamma-aminobutyric acid type B receptor
LDVVHNPHEGAESTALTDTNATREEEERHNRLLQENEDIKKQIAEVSIEYHTRATIHEILNREKSK